MIRALVAALPARHSAELAGRAHPCGPIDGLAPQSVGPTPFQLQIASGETLGVRSSVGAGHVAGRLLREVDDDLGRLCEALCTSSATIRSC